MSAEFLDIAIKSFDETSSGPSNDFPLFRLVLRLSHRAPGPWADYFNQAWKQHIYMMQRRAKVTDDRLEIWCMPDELEKDHIPELKKVISETNKAYREEISRLEATKQKEEKIKIQQKNELVNLKAHLNFD